MLVDLHTHSSFSDGRYTPSQLVEAAVAKGIGVLAITDHDSWNGIEEATTRIRELKTSLQLICGVELTTQYFNGESVHVLGYNVSRSYKPLKERMDEMRQGREQRLAKMLAKLKALGYEIEAIHCDPLNRAVGRPHVAKALVAKGYFATVQEVFDTLLYRGGPAYVPQSKMEPQEAVALIHAAGGLAVLAHPYELSSREIPQKLLAELDFDGVEAYHPSAFKSSHLGALIKEQGFYRPGEDHREIGFWLQEARAKGILVSGGSDFHGITGRIPEELGQWQVEHTAVAGLLQKLGIL